MTTYSLNGPGISVLAGYTQFILLAYQIPATVVIPAGYTEAVLAHPIYQAGNPAAFPLGTASFRAFYRRFPTDGASDVFTFTGDPSLFWVGWNYTLFGVRTVPLYTPGIQRVNSKLVQAASTNAHAGSFIVYANWGGLFNDTTLDPLFSPAAPGTGGVGLNLLHTYTESVATSGVIQRGGTGTSTYTEQEVDTFEFHEVVQQPQMVL